MRFQKSRPRSRQFRIGGPFDAVRFTDIGDGGFTDLKTDLGKLALDPFMSPHWTYLGESQSQIEYHLTHAWSALLLSPIDVVPFSCDQLSMPVKNRVRRKRSAT